MTSSDLKALLKRVVEIAMPDLRRYYRVTRKAKVVKAYPAAGGKYYADVQPLRNDESEDETAPVISHVEIPVIWAGPERGVVCPPVEGAHCDLSYYDGDPDYPRISNFRWRQMGAPSEEIDGFIIQQEPGVYIRISPESKIMRVTKDNIQDIAGKNWSAEAGKVASIKAPEILLIGSVTIIGTLRVIGRVDAEGDIYARGMIIDKAGNTNHHSH